MKQDTGYWTRIDQKKTNTFTEHLVKASTPDIRDGEEEEAIFNSSKIN